MMVACAVEMRHGLQKVPNDEGVHIRNGHAVLAYVPRFDGEIKAGIGLAEAVLPQLHAVLAAYVSFGSGVVFSVNGIVEVVLRGLLLLGGALFLVFYKGAVACSRMYRMHEHH